MECNLIIAIIGNSMSQGKIKVEDLNKEVNKSTIDKEILELLTDFSVDVGDNIYFMLNPDWDGEDDTYDFQSLEGLEKAINLESIYLVGLGNELDLKPLKDLKNLKKVYLSNVVKSNKKNAQIAKQLLEQGVEKNKDRENTFKAYFSLISIYKDIDFQKGEKMLQEVFALKPKKSEKKLFDMSVVVELYAKLEKRKECLKYFKEYIKDRECIIKDMPDLLEEIDLGAFKDDAEFLELKQKAITK